MVSREDQQIVWGICIYKVIDSVLMPGAEVAEGAVVTRALVADGIKIGKNAVVGDAASENIELVAKRVKGDE